MKKIFSLLVFLAFGFSFLQGQIQSSFKYQAVARQSDNIPYSNTDMGVRISILEGSTDGIVVFEESINVTTSSLGLFSLNVGATNPDLGNIEWSGDDYFVKVEIDPTGGTDYQPMGTSQILAVPMSLYAEKAGNVGDALQSLSIDSAAQVLKLSQGGGEIPLDAFGSSDADADPQNELQTLTWNGSTQEISISNGNSVTIPLATGEAASTLLDEDGDTRFFTENTRDDDSFTMQLEGEERFVFERVPSKSAVRFNIIDPGFNTLIGQGVGNRMVVNTTASEGMFNTFLGRITGSLNISGSFNTFLGHGAGKSSNASNNTFVGYNSGPKVTTGQSNTFLGMNSGAHHLTGRDNVLLGFSAGGGTNAVGKDNVMIGSQAGSLSKGSGNIFLGRQAGMDEEGDNKLYIDNNRIVDPLIYGEFDNNLLRVNGDAGLEVFHGFNEKSDGLLISEKLDSSFWRFFVHQDGQLQLFSKAFSTANGAAANVAYIDPLDGSFNSLSDKRFKTNFESLGAVLEIVSKLDVFKYNILGQKEGNKKSIGLLAQDVEKEFPELVNKNSVTGNYHLNYSGIGVVAIKAIQEQQDLIENQQIEIQSLKSTLNDLLKRIENLEEK